MILCYNDPDMAARVRNPVERVRDKAQILELKLRGYTNKEIAEVLDDKYGYALSPEQIKYDVRQIKEEIADAYADEVKTLLATELERFNVMEREAWARYREALVYQKRKTSTQTNADGNVVATFESEEDASDMVRFWFAQIAAIQKDRRKMMSMYTVNINVHSRAEVVTKAYVAFDPGTDWPQLSVNGNGSDVVDGELVDA